MVKSRILSMLSNTKKYILLNVLFQWGSLLSQIVIVFEITNVLDLLFKDQSVDIEKSATILLGSLIFRFIFDRLVSQCAFMASTEVKSTLRTKIYEKLYRLGASYQEKVNTSEVVQLATEGVEQLETYCGRYLPQLFYSLLAPITLFIVLSNISFKTSLILLICVPLIPISIIVVQKIAKKLLNKYWSIYTELGDNFLENLQGLTTLKIYQADEYYSQKMDEEASRFRKITMKVLTMQLNSTSVMDIIAYGASASGMIVVLIEYFNGDVTLINALRMILLSAEFFIPLRLLGSFFHIAMNGIAASDKIFNLLDMEELSMGTKNIMDTDIKFDHVSFSYENDREILNDIQFDLPKGSFVSLVGESGSGKSTIAKIIVGKNKQYKGHISIGKEELSNIRESSLKENITVISHNSYLFKGSVAEHLRMGNENANHDQMVEVLKKVNLWEYLSNQQGLETMIAEKGENFSGGQRQRLAIARGLLHDSKIYIFDEATSNIDSESETIIMNVIKDLSKKKSILLISHRLSNVVDSDTIYYLKNGTILEKGSHKELMSLNKEYSSLFKYQLELESYGGSCQ